MAYAYALWIKYGNKYKIVIVRIDVEKKVQDKVLVEFGVNVYVLALTKKLRLYNNMLELIFEMKKEIRQVIE